MFYIGGLIYQKILAQGRVIVTSHQNFRELNQRNKVKRIIIKNLTYY